LTTKLYNIWNDSKGTGSNFNISIKPSAQSSALENFFQKIHPCGSAYNIATSACFIYHFPLKNLQSSAQNYQNAEDTTLLYYIEAQKIAAELAAKSKYFLCSNHRTLEALKHKSAATLSIIAATFCSIIIETRL
jgi:hypothetical protein